MSDIVIKAEGLGKKYLIGHQSERERYTALRDVLTRNVKNVLHKTRQVLSGQQLLAGDEVEEFWALRDIDFEIKRGDRVGIIGRNGAGKSTLLKILSRITEPSAGRVEIRGRVASLLEVGTGFHPELTGRENIYLNGAILGMTRAEIKKKFDEIVDFAGVEKFLDTPVKRYSSGMYVRLAFAVAAHLEPEILVVDEVLAVGDAEFQKKCLGKMEDVSKNEGRTVLFVSHNMSAISSLCNTGVLLVNGRVRKDGEINDVIFQYQNGGDTKNNQWEGDAGDNQVRLFHTSVLPTKGHFHTDSDLIIKIKFRILQEVRNLVVGFHLFSKFEEHLAYSLVDDFNPHPLESYIPGIYERTFLIPKNTLGKGEYSIRFDIGIHNIKRIIFDEGRLFFGLVNTDGLGLRFIVPDEVKGFTSLFRPNWEVYDHS